LCIPEHKIACFLLIPQCIGAQSGQITFNPNASGSQREHSASPAG
jgi:hypothetical protein